MGAPMMGMPPPNMMPPPIMGMQPNMQVPPPPPPQMMQQQQHNQSQGHDNRRDMHHERNSDGPWRRDMHSQQGPPPHQNRPNDRERERYDGGRGGGHPGPHWDQQHASAQNFRQQPPPFQRRGPPPHAGPPGGFQQWGRGPPMGRGGGRGDFGGRGGPPSQWGEGRKRPRDFDPRGRGGRCYDSASLSCILKRRFGTQPVTYLHADETVSLIGLSLGPASASLSIFSSSPRRASSSAVHLGGNASKVTIKGCSESIPTVATTNGRIALKANQILSTSCQAYVPPTTLRLQPAGA
eukprot:scaffold1839_cov50-Cyclotella_meneghiniana.AAC.1